jgi:predicted DsbA family dithiol-disulfide isomerase
MKAIVYFDYVCPFAYRGVRLFTEMQRQRQDLNVVWRHFPLEQVNARDPDWKLWEQPLHHVSDRPGRTLPAFLASHAASLQGEDAFARFRLALFAARHDHGRHIADRDVLLEAARDAGLDMAAFEAHWDEVAGRERLRDDYLSGEAIGAFGVPTLVMDGCEPTYVRLTENPPAEQRDAFVDELVHLLCHRGYLQEVKRASAQG